MPPVSPPFKGKILLVDDDPGLLRLLSIRLRAESYEVEAVESAHKALATLNQLLEVIVGQVGEEGVVHEEAFVSLDQHTYRVDAATGILEINDELGVDLPEGGYQTLAGFLLDRLGRIPDEGDVVEYRNLRLTVRAMDGVRIDKVELRQIQSQRDESTE